MAARSDDAAVRFQNGDRWAADTDLEAAGNTAEIGPLATIGGGRDARSRLFLRNGSAFCDISYTLRIARMLGLTSVIRFTFYGEGST
jgi:hypothetical protein